MIRLTEKRIKDLAGDLSPIATLSLPIDVRIRSRARVQLDDGRDAGLFLPRGELLRGGDCLKTEDGAWVKVIAAPEMVSTVTAAGEQLLSRAAYHLGNRHVPLQVEEGWLRYLHDHVLDEMLEQMGFTVTVEKKAFEPESGAYSQAGHSHHHSH